MFALFTRLIVVPVSLSISSPAAPPVALLSDVAATTAAQTRRDSMTVTIAPAKRIEVKLVMKKGEKATFEWATNGAEVGYNLHGEVPTDPSVKAHIYQRGSSKGEKGSIEAVFDGVHGWSWRNTGEQPVTVTVKANGQFSALKKM
ncbi:hypothetical protein [Gemmatimonas sp.]|jgi:hypothetical protein|uniref:hypothetical protein n=1 Tax=Gemmatimonas sp. TaxID=1962908 RepID=UPI0037BFB8AC